MSYYAVYLFIFFFQAEDGIRDLTVTGVQTCALPICGCRSSGSCACTSDTFPSGAPSGVAAARQAGIIIGRRGGAVTDRGFCRIIERQTPSHIEFEDDSVVALPELSPHAPVHLLIVPP